VTAKPVILRALARRDADEAIDYYAAQVGPDIAIRFVDALEKAYRLVSIRPTTGSPRYAHELDLPGLRSRKLAGFPYLVFYLEHEDHIDVWRVLHAQRDIPLWMTETGI
jgi:toxin ParE1/3/4